MGKPVQFKTDRVIIGHDEGNTPELEPLFANHFELMQLNTDLFLDVGIIAPQDMLSAMNQAGEANDIFTVKFSILQRIAMSPATFFTLRNKINELAEQIVQMEVPRAGPLENKKMD